MTTRKPRPPRTRDRFGRLVAPADFDEAERREWASIVSAHPPGKFDESHSHMLRSLVKTTLLLIAAHAQVAIDGLTVTGRDGVRENPTLRTINRLEQQSTRLSSKLGLSQADARNKQREAVPVEFRVFDDLLVAGVPLSRLKAERSGTVDGGRIKHQQPLFRKFPALYFALYDDLIAYRAERGIR
ncbi:P27 family phage terminase small subunit [Paraburkholderia saeva]|uniref:Uncharacterized protein n=1 Tax=Paraburkholderia saeva TaxID=2777537 RepID=A0A9N8RYZ7_9BURK|nr:P27 family phage terminase small subunit [Paraburkholderia saeva]CAG4905751.1 hypothetical protein LMG31841_03483 [Paraburkholderia saeva]